MKELVSALWCPNFLHLDRRRGLKLLYHHFEKEDTTVVWQDEYLSFCCKLQHLARSWMSDPKSIKENVFMYQVSVQDETRKQDTSSHNTWSTEKTRTLGLCDGGIKVAHFDTEICHGDFGCNERSFSDTMQRLQRNAFLLAQVGICFK